MPSLDVVVETPVVDSFRVQQVAGMFDLPVAETARERFQVELPERDGDWQIGLIVGPSGSGKSTVAGAAFGAELSQDHSWPADRAVVDCFGDLPVRQVIELLTAVGFGSPPSWLKPYAVLSGGERFRCDLARALANPQEPTASRQQPMAVVDEFTSVVDRTVAKICSAAVAKGIRSGRIARRFVAVTCHYDIAAWLEPDWLLDVATGELQINLQHRRRLRRRQFQRPTIELEIHRCSVEAWRLFERHHYLSGSLHPQARCYLATWDGEPVSFAATLPLVARRRRRRFTRIVTLPDYQGVGIGMRFVAAVAKLEQNEGYRVSVTSSHPGLIAHCCRSPVWRTTNVKKPAASGAGFTGYRSAVGRAVVSFEFTPTSLSADSD